MKSTRILLTGCLLCASMSMDAAILTFKVANATAGDKAVITLSDKTRHEAVVDAAGNATLEIKGFEAQYATMRYGRAQKTLYLDPEQDLTLIFNGKEPWKAIEFEGDAAAVNAYLNAGQLKNLTFQDTKLPEEAFMQKADSLFDANIKVLDEATLPKAFAEKEQTRLKYFTYGMFPMHPVYYVYQTQDSTHVTSNEFYAKLKSLATIDAGLLRLAEYKEFLPNAVACMSTQATGQNGGTEQFVKYIDENIENAEVAEYLVNLFVYNHVNGRGLDKAETLVALFNKHVKSADLVEKFNALCAKWEKLKTGAPSPTFSCPDIDGKTVSLSDLKGKFVYIDVWATWCGPCRGELPHLKTLEEKYSDKDIHFVSLSCDQNKKAWENMVKKDEMKGIQLYLGTESAFMDDYLITGIPRFILLDRDGNIISADMSRPSDSKTAKKFDELLGL